MDHFAGFVIRHKKGITTIFLLLAAVGAVMSLGVSVNYNMADYLPESAQSTTAVEIMGDEFSNSVPNASVLVRDVSIPEALEYKQKLAEIGGVSEVLWLDDMVDVFTPLETLDADTVEGFYKDGDALFSVTIATGQEAAATDAIRALIGEDNALAGDAPDLTTMQSAATGEVINAALILIPAITLILLLSTSAWIEPLLFFAAIGVSILINMGTNVLFGEISFVTNSVSPILQLAVSLDYAIFLLHSFADFRRETDDVEEAMRGAIKKSIVAVAASAVTTLFGFLALTFMGFRIGADLGLNLAKGIVLSFISCMVFLPALIMCCYRALDRTQHRPLMPGFKNINRLLSKIAIPLLALVLIAVVPAFRGQARADFTYGNAVSSPDSRSAKETAAIQEKFGQSTILALLVPRGDIVREYDLSRALKDVGHVTGVMSFAGTVGTAIPMDFLDQSILDQFYSENYARIIVYTDTPNEGELAFSVVEAVHALASEYYGDSFYSAGQSANLYDMKNVVAVDNTRVNLIAIISIFAVLLLTFRSATLPLILLFTIEAGIWINLSIPYFTGTTINFLGYLVINTVQLGATVDYAILLTTYYMDNRRRMVQRKAIHQALGETFKSILVSAATLAIAGFALAATSSNPSVSEIGLLLCRGTLLSFFMVVCILPALLRMFDRLIGATTYKAGFYRKKRGVKA